MKNVILSIVAVGFGLAAVAGAYQLGLAAHGRYEVIAVNNIPVKLDRKSGRMWFVNSEYKLEIYENAEKRPKADEEASWEDLPGEDLKSLVLTDPNRSQPGAGQLQVEIYNPTSWRVQEIRVKVTATGDAPEQNWERTYATQCEILPESQNMFALSYFERPYGPLKMEIVSAKGTKTKR